MSGPTLTRPTGEQLRFRSATTGDHILDDYLEAAEKGGRELHDLLDDIFDSAGVFRASNFQFRYNDQTSTLQYRIGQFADPNTDWQDIKSFLNPRGAFSAANTYASTDIVSVSTDDVYIVHSLASPKTFADEAAFIASANTTRIVNLEAVRTSAAQAAASADTASAQAGDAAASALAASVSADAASDSETNAAASAAAALASEEAAAASETNAAASAATTQHLLPPSASNPATRADGNPVAEGDVYWNTASNEFRAYDGTTWIVVDFGVDLTALASSVTSFVSAPTTLSTSSARRAPTIYVQASTTLTVPAPTAGWSQPIFIGRGVTATFDFRMGEVDETTVRDKDGNVFDLTAPNNQVEGPAYLELVSRTSGEVEIWV